MKLITSSVGSPVAETTLPETKHDAGAGAALPWPFPPFSARAGETANARAATVATM